jgi:hypothetical protein
VLSFFDEVLLSVAANTSQSTEFRWLIDQSLWVFNTHSPYDWWTRLGNISLTPDMVKELPMPVFVGKSEDDNLTLNQPELTRQILITGRPNGEALTHYHQFNTSLGAGEHCALGAESQLAQVTLDWLSDVWGGYAFGRHMGLER